MLSSAAVLEFFDPKKKVDVKNRRDGKRQAQIFSSVWLGFVWVTGRGWKKVSKLENEIPISDNSPLTYVVSFREIRGK